MNMRPILILLTPLVGITFGAFIAYHNDIPVIAFSSNVIAVVLGIPLAIFASQLKIPIQRHQTIVSLLVLSLMATSLLSSDIAGVHRWISIGTTYLNISMVLVPLILYAISTSLGHNKFLPVNLTISISIIHMLQPDAGQATAFGCAAIVIYLLNNGVPFETRLIGIITIGVGTILAWCQPDSLPAVEHVEHILYLGTRIGRLGVAGIAFAIFSLIAPIFYTLQYQKINSDNGILALAFVVYLVAEFCVAELGNYPVPIIGAGASPILGWYLIIGLTVPSHIFRITKQRKETPS